MDGPTSARRVRRGGARAGARLSPDGAVRPRGFPESSRARGGRDRPQVVFHGKVHSRRAVAQGRRVRPRGGPRRDAERPAIPSGTARGRRGRRGRAPTEWVARDLRAAVRARAWMLAGLARLGSGCGVAGPAGGRGLGSDDPVTRRAPGRRGARGGLLGGRQDRACAVHARQAQRRGDLRRRRATRVTVAAAAGRASPASRRRSGGGGAARLTFSRVSSFPTAPRPLGAHLRAAPTRRSPPYHHRRRPPSHSGCTVDRLRPSVDHAATPPPRRRIAPRHRAHTARSPRRTVRRLVLVSSGRRPSGVLPRPRRAGLHVHLVIRGGGEIRPLLPRSRPGRRRPTCARGWPP